MHYPVPPGNRDSTDATNFAILAKTREFLKSPRFHAFFVVFCTSFFFTFFFTFHAVYSAFHGPVRRLFALYANSDSNDATNFVIWPKSAISCQ